MQTRLTQLESEQMLADIKDAQVRAQAAFDVLQRLIRQHVERAVGGSK